ncbi:MAG: hypothetical protein WCI51_22885 [Lentisphaerota bacterium]
MSIRFRCKKCNQKYELDDDCSGDTLDCIRCKISMEVPRESEIPPNDHTLNDLTPIIDGKEKIQEIKISSSTAKNKAPDDIIFRCKICNQKYRLPKSIGGQIAECAKCKKNMIVPKQSDGASATSKETVLFWCKSCGQKYRLPKSIAGEEGECSRCHNTFVVPGKSEERPPAPESRKAIEKATAIASFIPVVDKNKDKVQKISVHSTTLRNKSPDDIIFRCKVCNQKYRLPKGLGGQLAECAKCKKNMVVPGQSDGLPASADPQENVTFWCKSCGQKYRLPKELAGQEGECTRCNKIFEVPVESEGKPPEMRPEAAEKHGVPVQINLQTPDQSEKRFESRGDLPAPSKHFLSKTPAAKKPETTKSAKPATTPPVITRSPPNKYPERDAEKTQTSIAMTKTARTMVKYVLEIPERNFFFVSFSLIIDWLMQITMFCRMPRKLVIFLLIFTTSLAMLITWSGIKIYERSVKGGTPVNVMCASCKLRETRPVNNIFTAKCSKCSGTLGFQWKCNYCSGVFTRIERKTEDNPIQYDKIDAIKPPACPFCNSTAVKYLAPPKPEPPGQPKKINIRKNRN